jgi:hypothetical protein
MKFITLTLKNGKNIRLKRTSILGLEEKGNCTIVYFNSMTVTVLETVSDIERIIFE